MKADELQRIATRLSNQCFVRHWLHWNAPHEPAIMAIECRDSWGRPQQVADMPKYGFEWDDIDHRYYINRSDEQPAPMQNLHLDTSLEKARALHRVWRALNDGDCPKCHTFHRATEILQDFGRPMPIAEWDGSFVTQSIGCPTCGFSITRNEIVEIEKMFAPAMDAAVQIFENWRSTRATNSQANP